MNKDAKTGRRSPADGPALKSGGRDARKTAALVLEVLAGVAAGAENWATAGM